MTWGIHGTKMLTYENLVEPQGGKPWIGGSISSFWPCGCYYNFDTDEAKYCERHNLTFGPSVDPVNRVALKLLA